MRITLFAILILIVFGCTDQESDENLESPSCFVEAEILGVDNTFHACGGGYIIRTANDQFAVFDLNDDSLEEEAFQLTIYDDPIKVLIAFENKDADERCSHYSKNITCISKKN